MGHGGTGHQGKVPRQHWGDMCTKEGHGSRGQGSSKIVGGVWG